MLIGVDVIYVPSIADWGWRHINILLYIHFMASDIPHHIYNARYDIPHQIYITYIYTMPDMTYPIIYYIYQYMIYNARYDIPLHIQMKFFHLTNVSICMLLLQICYHLVQKRNLLIQADHIRLINFFDVTISNLKRFINSTLNFFESHFSMPYQKYGNFCLFFIKKKRVKKIKLQCIFYIYILLPDIGTYPYIIYTFELWPDIPYIHPNSV